MKTLSSASTLALKLVLPILPIVHAVAIFAPWGQKAEGTFSPPFTGFTALQYLFYVIGWAVLIHSGARLKRVQMDSTTLYVANYFKRCSIPLKMIEAVTQSRWWNGDAVTIHLHQNTPFGRRIVFAPKGNPVSALIRRPGATTVADLLKDLAALHEEPS
jgi:hypothetical protein